MTYEDQFGAKKTLDTTDGKISYFDINVLEQSGMGSISKLPFSIKILLESLLRNVNGYDVMAEDVANLAKWSADPGDISVSRLNLRGLYFRILRAFRLLLT